MKIIKKRVHGYIFIRIGETFIPQHRLVVEEYIGRLLTYEEVVHHINGDKSDNKISNLMLFKNQKEHRKFHNKISQFGYTKPIINQINNRWNEWKK